MSIKVLFFASLREQLGQSNNETDWQEGLTTAAVWQQCVDGTPLPDNVLIAKNQEYCDQNALVNDGDEIAFFPPVTGG